MNSKLLLATLFLLFALVSASSAQAGRSSIGGSEWVGNDDDDVTTFSFEKDGTLAYSYNGNSFRNGTWSQEGTTVRFEMNKNYRSFTGTLAKDTISGTSENTAGKKWELTMYRYEHPKCSSGSFAIGRSCDAVPAIVRSVPTKPGTSGKKRPASQKK